MSGSGVRGVLCAGVLLAGLGVASFPGVGHALTIVETTDFGDSTSVTPLGLLDVGINEISGGLDGTCSFLSPGFGSCSGGDAIDAFTVTVAPGQELTGIAFEILDSGGPAGYETSASAWEGSPSNVLFPFIVNAEAVSPTGNLLTSPLDAGEYRFSFFGQNTSEEGAFFANYKLSLVVVPEPTTGLLLGLGLAGMGMRRRRAAEPCCQHPAVVRARGR